MFELEEVVSYKVFGREFSKKRRCFAILKDIAESSKSTRQT